MFYHNFLYFKFSDLYDTAAGSCDYYWEVFNYQTTMGLKSEKK